MAVGDTIMESGHDSAALKTKSNTEVYSLHLTTKRFLKADCSFFSIDVPALYFAPLQRQ